MRKGSSYPVRGWDDAQKAAQAAAQRRRRAGTAILSSDSGRSSFVGPGYVDEDADGYGQAVTYGSGSMAAELEVAIEQPQAAVSASAPPAIPTAHTVVSPASFGMEFGGTFGGEEPAQVYTAGPFRPGSTEHRISRIATDYPALLSLARSLGRMAREEIERLEGARPNDTERAEINRRQCDLLTILADGFARIAAALEAVAEDPHQALLLGKASEIVQEVGEQLTAWWKSNAAEAIDWAVRIPVVVGSIPMLAWGGADMTVGTTMVGVLVGGQKVVKVLTRRRKSK
jgi:hypothetical protein